jgi:NAD(P)-dependent dehydrogenase (short-subunit alcohol dehydrogenase family)
VNSLETMFGLAGRTALVTGGSRGIGRAACVGLATAGAAVAVHYGSDAVAAAEVVAEIEGMGGRAVAVGADLTRPEEIGPMLHEVAAFTGESGLGVLVNNAGVYPPGTIETLTADEWDRVFALNARAPFLVTQAALPLLRRAGAARVINIGTVMFHRGSPGSLHYVASKGAVMGLTHSLARALGPDGITVNCLVPSIVGTETVNRNHADGVDAIVAEQSVGRYQQPGDLVGAILWLASPASAFTTGQTVMADGGRIFL